MDNEFFMNSTLPSQPELQFDHLFSLDQFDSALSSMVSSPTSNSTLSTDNFMMRELIGKLENSPCLGNSIGLSSNLPAMPSDPGFAERAARFSSFGSRSFNGRTTTNHGDFVHRSCSNLGGGIGTGTGIGIGKLQRVLSSPSLKVEARSSRVDNNNSMNDSSENSSILGPNQGKENGSGRKRKAGNFKGNKTEEKIGSCSQMPTNSNKVVENENDTNAKRKRSDECGSDSKEGEKNPEEKAVEPLKDYIHVRARRGQATDSHSLAERVRREKIGERMKLLQDLLPGCNKVTGKALMLEEIINYVQSLQKQVEFLSMKLSNVDARVEMNMSNQHSKDEIQPNGYPMYPTNMVPTQYAQGQQQQLHHHPLQDSLTTMDPFTPSFNLNNHNHNHNHNHVIHPSPFDGFFNCLSQIPSLYEGDLQSIVEMGRFSQKEAGFQAQSLHNGTNTTQMKIEF